MVVNLWFEVALLTNSLFEAVKLCQGGSMGKKLVPLNHNLGEKWVFIVVSQSVQFSESQLFG